MKTLTITDARQNLGHWLKLAANGEDVGVIVGSDNDSHILSVSCELQPMAQILTGISNGKGLHIVILASLYRSSGVVDALKTKGGATSFLRLRTSWTTTGRKRPSSRGRSRAWKRMLAW